MGLNPRAADCVFGTIVPGLRAPSCPILRARVAAPFFPHPSSRPHRLAMSQTAGA